MKIPFSLALLAIGAAYAQRPVFGGRPDDRFDDRSVEGRYVSLQRDGSVVRTLRLDRDGSAEIVTEYRKRDRDRGARDGYVRLSDRDVQVYGTTADDAARGRPVRQTGRWALRGGQVTVRFDDFGPSRRNGDLRFERSRDTLTQTVATDLYGRQRIVFERDLGLPPVGRYGRLLLGREAVDIDRLDYAETRDGALLTVRGGGQRVELRGRVDRRGDDVTLRLGDGRSRDDGTFRLRLRGSDVVSISGSGTVDGRRVEFRDREDRNGLPRF